ncbi:MAG: redox-sensing transcriptional repressor Rex [Culicoidibacterales bacterium]
MKQKLPGATARRFPLYYRQLVKLKESGVVTILSQELADLLDLDPSTVRRDFSYIGEMGVQKVGYNVEYLVNNIGDFLGQGEVNKAVLIGFGHLGKALLNYNYIQGNEIEIVAAFDIKSKDGELLSVDVPLHHETEIEEKMSQYGAKVAILATPSDVAQALTDRLVENGVEGILNFSSTRIRTPKHVYVNNVDLAAELQLTAFYVKNNDQKRTAILSKLKKKR